MKLVTLYIQMSSDHFLHSVVSLRYKPRLKELLSVEPII